MKTVDLYILNAAENSDLRDMKPAERQKVEERRLLVVRELVKNSNTRCTQIMIDGYDRNAILVPKLTPREADDVWYCVTTTFGDFNPDRKMFDRVDIEDGV